MDLTGPRPNHPEQPVGAPVTGAFPVPRPDRAAIAGRLVRLEPADPGAHAADLFAAYAESPDGAMWTYMAYGLFARCADLRHCMDGACRGTDPLFSAVRDMRSGRALGLVSYLRIDPQSASIELGHISLAPAL